MVEQRLAACVNILPGMISHYRWQGVAERGEEAVMLIKTRASLAEAVRAAVKASHSLRDAGHPRASRSKASSRTYFGWMLAETEPGRLTSDPRFSVAGAVTGKRSIALIPGRLRHLIWDSSTASSSLGQRLNNAFSAQALDRVPADARGRSECRYRRRCAGSVSAPDPVSPGWVAACGSRFAAASIGMIRSPFVQPHAAKLDDPCRTNGVAW